jgi:two-component system sensor histidine kinase DesK
MAAVLPLRLAPGWVPGAYDSAGVVLLRRPFEIDRLIRVASAGAIVSGVVFAIVGLCLYAVIPSSEYLPLATAATALALALHVRHLRHALVGCRAPDAGWTLAVMAVVIFAPTPLIGAAWLQMFHLLAASALLVLRPRWGLPAYLGVAVAAALWATTFDQALSGPPAGIAAWSGLSVISRGLAPVIIVWLVVALRQLESARHLLATKAVEAERQRIADELKRSVGDQLEGLIAQGVRSSELLPADPASAEHELRLLVDQSRRTLSNTRRLLRRYTMPARAELETAGALLRAAGIDATLEIPERVLPATADEPMRSSLRRLTNELLRDDPGGRVVITLTPDRGESLVDHRTYAATVTGESEA